MGGVNPYIAPAKVKPPTRKYRVTFLPLNMFVDVDPAKGRPGHDGLPFSILDIAEGAHIDLDHSCGGVCACSTCHVYVREGMKSCNEATDDENDQLDDALRQTFPARDALSIIFKSFATAKGSGPDLFPA